MSMEFDKTFQNEGNTPLITKITLRTFFEHFWLKLLDPQKSLFGNIILEINDF